MHSPADLIVCKFGSADDYVKQLQLKFKGIQAKYIYHYLEDLGAKTVIVEPHYFDKNFLSEFSAFYSKSARGYSNKCMRLHYFSFDFDKDKLKRFLSDDPAIEQEFSKYYLGFIVIRPFGPAPFGTTVLKQYNDRSPMNPRVLTARSYFTQLAGKKLEVEGLSWQQQDTSVGACATIALWTALNSSAFDDHHAIPTTAEITRLAHKTASLGSRVFPSSGLTVIQMCEAIKENKLSPIIISGDIQGEFFSQERFLSSVCSLLRSEYPVIAIGNLEGVGRHAVCITGFRESKTSNYTKGQVSIIDSSVESLYIHDDNLGPNVRVKIESKKEVGANGSIEFVSFVPEAPSSPHTVGRTEDTTQNYHHFLPTQLLIAVHDDVCVSPDDLNKLALEISTVISQLFNTFNLPQEITCSSMIMRTTRFISDELSRIMLNKKKLGDIRLQLWEKVRPMSFHVGIIRIGIGNQVVLDILYDTSEGRRELPAFAHIVYSKNMINILKIIEAQNPEIFGVQIQAF